MRMTSGLTRRLAIAVAASAAVAASLGAGNASAAERVAWTDYSKARPTIQSARLDGSGHRLVMRNAILPSSLSINPNGRGMIFQRRYGGHVLRYARGGRMEVSYFPGWAAPCSDEQIISPQLGPGQMLLWTSKCSNGYTPRLWRNTTYTAIPMDRIGAVGASLATGDVANVVDHSQYGQDRILIVRRNGEYTGAVRFNSAVRDIEFVNGTDDLYVVADSGLFRCEAKQGVQPTCLRVSDWVDDIAVSGDGKRLAWTRHNTLFSAYVPAVSTSDPTTTPTIVRHRVSGDVSIYDDAAGL